MKKMNFKCAFNNHEYEVLEELPYTYDGKEIGKVYVNRCKHCGKLDHIKVKTVMDFLG